MTQFIETSQKLLQFIDESPTCFHAVANCKKRLEESGFQKLEEADSWQVQAGGKYYVTRNDSAFIAFWIPQGTWQGFHMAASHSDSPTFKIKESPEMVAENSYVKLNVEKYGGMILSTWLDRPLSAAGRVIVKENGKMVTKLVSVDKDLLLIPNVAIHMNRDMNKGMEYNAQVDMLPLYSGETDKDTFMNLIAAEANVKPEAILGHDLYLYLREKGKIWGADGAYIASGRLDDLQCVYASVEAFRLTMPETFISVCAVFDNEEVGSGTKQGADSTFLKDVLQRVNQALGRGKEEYQRAVAESFMISADNAHAVHPNHPEKADPTNRPYLNGGIVIKYQGSQKYTTDAMSGAIMKDICKEAKVPYQTYANRSDLAGGSTLGNISTAQVSVNTVDIGLPQLAMHSAYETAGVKDTEYLIRALQVFYGK